MPPNWWCHCSSLQVVAAVRNWTSMAFLLYWQRVEDIIALNTVEA
jgi:hypothetical protein